MLSHLKERLNKTGITSLDKVNFLREFLQLDILRILDEKGYFNKIAFVGGTALRILYDLRRFSEDLDFSVTEPSDFSFSKMIEAIAKELQYENIAIETICKDSKTVGSAFIKFKGLPHELGLSSLKDQKLFIKLEIDK